MHGDLLSGSQRAFLLHLLSIPFPNYHRPRVLMQQQSQQMPVNVAEQPYMRFMTGVRVERAVIKYEIDTFAKQSVVGLVGGGSLRRKSQRESKLEQIRPIDIASR